MTAELIGMITRPILQSMLKIDEIDVKQSGNTVQYTLLTSTWGKENIAETLINIKTAIYSLMPPIRRLKVISITPVQEGRLTTRSKVIVEAKFANIKRAMKRASNMKKRIKRR